MSFHMHRNAHRLIALSGVLLVAGCARVPQTDVDAANAAFEAARQAEAELYAPDRYQVAAQAIEALRAELAVQQAKSAPSRDYDSTAVLAAAARAAADSALAGATRAKEAKRQEVAQVLNQAKADFQQLKANVARAPAALRTDAGTIERMLVAADSAFGAGRYVEARDGAAFARQQIELLRNRLTQPARTRRG